ncbi:unnamed protein product [Enterobius vermicularis]|uniref:Ion_trans domain-containing protein n=1 Tax=Enterobius vermicularis TaxID=51028 RepID=A0A0N4UZW0_ENTVE|nr:unnamed protein product [Enterobius vermicularis]
MLFLFNFEKKYDKIEIYEQLILMSEYLLCRNEDRGEKHHRRWNILRHPMVLNYINEKLLERASFYIIHICAYFIFLLLLSSYIFGKTDFQDIFATLFLIVFGFGLVIKCAVKLQKGDVTRWFVLSYSFNLITYICTFLFVWTPTLFAYDNYHQELKQLFLLGKSPSGIYILMMARILYSFSQIAIIWIPTLLAFAFAFHLVMRNSGTEPWEATEAFTSANATFGEKLLAIFQAVTKTSTMMIGEVDADTVLGRKQWIPNVLLIAFEVITVILLMNLMVSLAVGDVSELRNSAQDKLLEIKVSFVVESLQLSEATDCFGDSRFSKLHVKRTNNVLVVEDDGNSFTTMRRIDFDEKGEEASEVSKNVLLSENRREMPVVGIKPGFNVLRECVHGTGNRHILDANEAQINQPNICSQIASKTYYIHFPTEPRGMRLEKKSIVGRTVQMVMDGAVLHLIEGPDSGIKSFIGKVNGESDVKDFVDEEGWKKKFSRWLIGLDWSCLYDVP